MDYYRDAKILDDYSFRKNFINEKNIFCVDFISGRKGRGMDQNELDGRRGFSTVATKIKTSGSRPYQRFNRRAYYKMNEQLEKKRKERQMKKIGNKQRVEKKKQLHKIQKSKSARIRSRYWSSYKYAIQLTHNRNLKASIEVQAHWKTTTQFNYSSLYKLQKDIKKIEIKNLERKGKLYGYNKVFDDVSPTRSASIDRSFLKEYVFYNIRPPTDPILIGHAKMNTGNVFVSSNVLSMIFSACRSVQSWDLTFIKRKGKIFVDHRIPSRATLMSVDESSRSVPDMSEKGKNNVNSAKKLSVERTLLNYCFSQQVLNTRAKPTVYSEKLPFSFKKSSKKLASKGHIYKKFSLGKNINVVVRCDVNGITEDGQPIITRAVHEYKSKKEGNWTYLLESSPGTIIVNEVQHNSFDFSRWIFEALLVKAKYLIVGFCSRKKMFSDKSHAILDVETYEVKRFSNQFNVKLSNGWAIFEKIILHVMGLMDGNYTLLKIPNKQSLCMYHTNVKKKREIEDI